MDAGKPEISFVSDCSTKDPIPYEGSILNPDDRIRYYTANANAMDQLPTTTTDTLMNDIAKQGK